MSKPICMIFDPIPFEGGSKIATRYMLEQTKENIIYYVLTADINGWQKHLKKNKASSSSELYLQSLICPTRLQNKTHGRGYWLKQWLYVLNLVFFWLQLFIKNKYVAKKILLISSPNVDLAGYIFTFLLKPFIQIKLIQCIHGSIFSSKAVSWCLKQNHTIFYLVSVEKHLKKLLKLSKNDSLPKNFHVFINGIPHHQWPKQRKKTDELRLFWAASLLKWKGLDRFIKAHQLANLGNLINTQLCYIKPKNTSLAITPAPIRLCNTAWFENPVDIDEIRSNSAIYVSTSQNEPFGLSILEALATGLLVIIPSDGAYWDSVLTDKINCLKYDLHSSTSLASTLIKAVNHFSQFEKIIIQGQELAKNYQAEKTYRFIANTLLDTRLETETS